jgi:transcriptional regulator with XRE-family HTH domain
MHIGEKIAEICKLKHISRQKVGEAIGLTGSSATYIIKRPSIDVEHLAKIGNLLHYNFFKHYPIVEDEAAAASSPENIERANMKTRIEELEKQLEACKRDLLMQKQENVYLKKINELLDKK